jgi:hypothetical protein
MDAGLQPQQADALRHTVVNQVVKHRFPEPQAAKLRADVHPLEFSVTGAKQLDAATRGRDSVVAEQEEGDTLRK